jgi:hypothetical protein
MRLQNKDCSLDRNNLFGFLQNLLLALTTFTKNTDKGILMIIICRLNNRLVKKNTYENLVYYLNELCYSKETIFDKI